MNRRTFLQNGAAGMAWITLGPAVGRSLSSPARSRSNALPTLLSDRGCSRATGYAETNKIVTLEGCTHVAWLDSEPEGFRVKVRTLDHESGQWASPLTLGHAYDNHGGPALTCDSKGRLHIVYFPHHHPFRYRRSLKPNDASAWSPDYTSFGERCTYPTLMCGPDDTLYLTCRESRKDGPWRMQMYWKHDGDNWQGPRTLLQGSATGGYAHFQESLAWSPDHRRLHLACRIYDGSPGHGHTLGYMYTEDFGKRWRRVDDSVIDLPATPESITNIAHARGEPGRSLRGGALAVDREGRPHVVYSAWKGNACRMTWAVLGEGQRWEKRDLQEHLTGAWSSWSLSMPGNLHVHPAGDIRIVATLLHPDIADEKQAWGHPTNEVALLDSSDGGDSFQMRVLSKIDEQTPHWLPNMEKPTGFNRVDRPGVIYTAGTRGDRNTQIVANEVHWVAL